MAGRKDKNTVDYFPHYCISGKTLFIIESKFSHVGYSVWFKTLELLGSNENHYIDLRNESDMLFLISKLKITEEQFTDIYNLLSKLDAIDSFLWSKKIVYSENFVKNIDDAYKRRSNKCMHKLDLCKHLSIKCTLKEPKSEQESTEYSKVKESKEEKIKQAEFVFLFESEYEKLISDYGKVNTDKLIKELDNYKGANGKKYKSDYRAILSWVVKKVLGDNYHSSGQQINPTLSAGKKPEVFKGYN